MRHRIPKFAVLSVAIAVTAFTAMSAGGFSLFSTSSTATQALSSGTLNVTLGAGSSPTGDYLTYAVTSFGPSDTVSMGATVTNAGTLPAIVSVTLAPSPSTALTADATNGLTVTVDGCAGTLTATPATPTNGVAGQEVYSCSGTLLPTAANGGPIASLVNTPITVPLSSAPDGSLGGGANAGVVVTYGLPGTASQTAVQGQSTTMSYSFSATQTAGAPQ
jgi:hypothetical protein